MNLDRELKSMRFVGRLFHKLTTRSEKKDDLEDIYGIYTFTISGVTDQLEAL